MIIDQLKTLVDSGVHIDRIIIYSHGRSASQIIYAKDGKASSRIADTEFIQMSGLMSDSGTIALTGCDIANGSGGEAYVDKLAQITGKNVEAGKGWYSYQKTTMTQTGIREDESGITDIKYESVDWVSGYLQGEYEAKLWPVLEAKVFNNKNIYDNDRGDWKELVKRDGQLHGLYEFTGERNFGKPVYAMKKHVFVDKSSIDLLKNTRSWRDENFGKQRIK